MKIKILGSCSGVSLWRSIHPVFGKTVYEIQSEGKTVAQGDGASIAAAMRLLFGFVPDVGYRLA